MKDRLINIFWAVIMIAGGGIFLLREMGILDFALLSTWVWAAVFGVLSVFFFLTYFIKGTDRWGWLFPATILGAISATIALENTAAGEALSGALILAAIAVPFLVAYFENPEERKWALIPSWGMGVLTFVVLFERYLGGYLTGTIVLYGIALPFLFVYLTDRSKKWALIPFAAMAVVGLIPLMEAFLDERALVLIIMVLFSVPFFVVYFWAKQNWWALIPAGVFASIAAGTGLDYFLQPTAGELNEAIMSTAILGGLGLTFGLLWLRRDGQPTDWAKYPALILIVLAVIVLAAQESLGLAWPILLIGAGAAVLTWGLLSRPKG